MATQAPFPLIAPRSTELRMAHFDEQIYKGDSSTLVYKIVDALCGTVGAGALVNEALLARLGAALETIYFNELDFIFGKMSFLSRSPAESYPYNPSQDLLTSEQWDEVRVKDAWYRARISEFFAACSKGSTPNGIRACVHAALAVDADIYEVWRYVDNFGITADLGRAETSARNEVVVRPHKDTLSPGEMRLLRDMLTKMASIDTLITIKPEGLAVHTPVPITGASADSTYYEVQKMVTPTPLLDNLPAPDLLAIDLLTTEQWMFSKDPTLAPYAAFNITSEYGYFYLVGGGTRSPIDSVTAGTLQADGSVRPEANFEVYEETGQYTDWIPYEKADSPDNYPGGKYGLTPYEAPAKNPDGSPYTWRYASQTAYVTAKSAQVIAMGGIANADHYKLPITAAAQNRRPYLPEYAVAFSAPARDSTVSSSLTRRRGVTASPERRDPANFVRAS
ncbi:hypothetical protein SEA_PHRAPPUCCINO_87 [Mycobacterium phage Phrappuccino]|uniref:Minor tail protein n=1 Tax=Mycobacterium phage Phrappuccino TaxID=2591223 RepID=A0A514DDT1_9CAUD|nr:virion structural protein [Mycobacterium phage Phrappuccino]QDH91762.1 hypothetical protein SEA_PHRAPPUCCINO_87 [Mycobacterium phage Phrappuccino]QIQ63204.1 hypothetical protein SEA_SETTECANDELA_87 [Mycobacterium phage Settecandela]